MIEAFGLPWFTPDVHVSRTRRRLKAGNQAVTSPTTAPDDEKSDPGAEDRRLNERQREAFYWGAYWYW